MANRPDIIIKNRKDKTCILIDVAIPADRNIIQKEAKNKLNVKCMIIPVVIGATGIVTKALKKNLEAIPGKHSIHSQHKTAILGTSHIIRKVLQFGT